MGAAITGFGGDVFILDDPQKPVDAQSEPQRARLNEWFSNTLLSVSTIRQKASSFS